jgi:hypothetical protein
MIISSPHFYNASPEYQSYVQGLNPDKTKHENFIYIEPVSTSKPDLSTQIHRTGMSNFIPLNGPPSTLE